MWNEQLSSRNWNESQTNMKNTRKVSAKQHYLSVARYVAGHSTNLSSRYRKFHRIVWQIIIIYIILALHYFLGCLYYGQNEFHLYLLHITEYICECIDEIFLILGFEMHSPLLYQLSDSQPFFHYLFQIINYISLIFNNLQILVYMKFFDYFIDFSSIIFLIFHWVITNIINRL